MPPTLIGLSYVDTVRPARLPHFEYLDLTRTDHPFRNWRIIVQGPRVFFVTPAGWTPSKPDGTGEGPSTMVEVARNKLALYWSGVDADAGGVEKWASPVKDDGKAGKR